MKTCPVCHSMAFDDASICFGCMHRFDEEPEEAAFSFEMPPEFRIKFTPMREQTGVTWKCAVEMA